MSLTLIRHHDADARVFGGWRSVILRCESLCCRGENIVDPGPDIQSRGFPCIDDNLRETWFGADCHILSRYSYEPNPSSLIQSRCFDTGIQRSLAAYQSLLHRIGSTLLLRYKPVNLRTSFHRTGLHCLQGRIRSIGGAFGSIRADLGRFQGAIHNGRLIRIDSHGERANHNEQKIKKQLAALVLIVLLFPLALACVRLGDWAFQKKGAAFAGGIGGVVVILVVGQFLVYCSLRLLIG